MTQPPNDEKAKIGADWKDWYAPLKRHDFDLYRKTIECVEGVTLTHQVPTNIAADYERTAVLLVCTAIGLVLVSCFSG